MLKKGSSSSSPLGIYNSSAKIFSPVEVKKVTPYVGDLGSSSSKTASVDEVGDPPNWISDLRTSGSLWLVKYGIWVWDGGVSLLSLGGVSGVVGIKLLPLAMNLPLESLSLRISFFLDVRNEAT